MSFVKSIMQTSLVRAFLIGEAILLGVIHARWLGAEGIGVLALLLLLKNFAFRFGNLGLGSAFAFFLAKKKVSIHQAIRVLWIAGGVMSALSILAILAIWRHNFSPWNDIPPTLFYLALPTVSLIFFNQYMRRVLSGQLRITAMNMAELLMGFSRLLFVCIFVICFQMGVKGAVLAILLSDTLAFFFLVLQTRANRVDIVEKDAQQNSTGELISRFWQYGRWNYLLMFSNFLCEELPMILLKKISLMNAPVGFFVRARGIGQCTRVVVQPVSQMLFPYTAASQEKVAIHRTNILCRNSLLVAILTIGLMVFFIKPIIVILYGKEFLPAVGVFYALTPGFLFWPLGRFIGIHIAASGKPKNVFFLSLITLLSGAPISYCLISKYGMVGAGLSVSAINAIMISLRLLLYTKLTRTPFSQVLFPRPSDITYYQNAFIALRWRIVSVIRRKN